MKTSAYFWMTLFLLLQFQTASAVKPSDFFCMPQPMVPGPFGTRNATTENLTRQTIAYKNVVQDCGDKSVTKNNVCHVMARCVYIPNVKSELKEWAKSYGMKYDQLTSADKEQFLSYKTNLETLRAPQILAQLQSLQNQLQMARVHRASLRDSRLLEEEIKYFEREVLTLQKQLRRIVENKYAGVRTDMLCEGTIDSQGEIFCPHPENCKGDILHKTIAATQVLSPSTSWFHPSNPSESTGSGGAK